MPRLVIRPGPSGKKLTPINAEELEEGLAQGTLRKVGPDLYQEVTAEVEPATGYRTSDLQPAPRKAARPRKSKQ